MNRKVLIFVFIIICIVICVKFIDFNREKSDNNFLNTLKIQNNLENIEQNEFGYYIVEKDDGSEVITESYEKARWYAEHPNYNPEPVHIE